MTDKKSQALIDHTDAQNLYVCVYTYIYTHIYMHIYTYMCTSTLTSWIGYMQHGCLNKNGNYTHHLLQVKELGIYHTYIM